MKICRFCLESFHDSAAVCGHCGNWEPKQKELARAYRNVLNSLTHKRFGLLTRQDENFMTKKQWRFILPSILALFLGFKAFFEGNSPLMVGTIIFLIFVWYLHSRIQAAHRTKIAFEDALLIEEGIQEKLRTQRVKKSKA